MTCTCKECGRTYTYNDEVGYSKDLCGPFCDGRHRRTAEVFRLRALLGEAWAKLICFPLMTRNPKLSEEVNALAARIAAEVEEK